MEQKYGDKSRPYLNLQGILWGAEKAFDVEVLLEISEKDFYQPSWAIQSSNGTCHMDKAIGLELSHNHVGE